jgi:hypothetical protein
MHRALLLICTWCKDLVDAVDGKNLPTSLDEMSERLSSDMNADSGEEYLLLFQGKNCITVILLFF